MRTSGAPRTLTTLRPMPAEGKRPFRLRFPENLHLRTRSYRSLEDAVWAARFETRIEPHEEGLWGVDLAIIENTETDYRWIVRRAQPRIEMETREDVAAKDVWPDLTLEEAEALELAAGLAKVEDRRTARLVEQARSKLRMACSPVRRGLDRDSGILS